MKIFFHHNRPIASALEEWRNHRHPGHVLYGITHFEKHGIIYTFRDRPKKLGNRFRVAWLNFKDIYFGKEYFDVLYGSSFRGLELLVFMRSLGLFRKPIVVWHHTAIVSSRNIIKEFFSKLFYRGFDALLFFTPLHIEESVKTKKVKPAVLKLIHWGADLDFYDRLIEESCNTKTSVPLFISTGQENRDFKTLTEAFILAKKPIEIYTKKISGTGNFHRNYEAIFNSYTPLPDNIDLTFVDGIIPYDLAKKVINASAVVICCLNLPYPVGSTTLVEAMALGKPIIATSNPYFVVDVEKENIGIKIAHEDVDGWVSAINKICENKELSNNMGRNGRQLSEKLYNLDVFTREVASIFHSLKSKNSFSKYGKQFHK